MIHSWSFPDLTTKSTTEEEIQEKRLDVKSESSQLLLKG